MINGRNLFLINKSRCMCMPSDALLEQTRDAPLERRKIGKSGTKQGSERNEFMPARVPQVKVYDAKKG